MTIVEASQSLRAGKVTSRELVEQALQAAHAEQPRLNAFITFLDESAREQARARDEDRLAGKDHGPLHGVPVAVKDNLFMAGVRCTNGTRILADYVPQRDAASVVRLRQAGAVIIGKTNMHELAYGITSSNPHYGPVRNPHDPSRIPGGSSGGSGAAVAAGVVPMALGSDTGGSIRIPAAYCGTVGLKPTYGLVNRGGCQPLGLTLDHVGPLTRTVEDARLVLEVLIGRKVNGGRADVLRFGIPDAEWFEDSDAVVADLVRQAIAKAGLKPTPVSLPSLDEVNTIARVVLLCEAPSSYEAYWSRRDEFGKDVLALLDAGRQLPATAYVNAQRARTEVLNQFQKVFRDIDVLLTPMTPNVAPPIGEASVSINGKPVDVRLAATQFARGINVIGYPAISIPCGTVDGLPVGMQLVARPGEDALLLDAAQRLETAITR